MRWPVRRKRLDLHVLSQSALATFCSADYSRSACAVFAANLENIDKLDSQRDANRFVFWNSLDMNGQLLLKFYWLLYFVEPGSFDSSTEGCFCEVSSSTVAGLFRWC